MKSKYAEIKRIFQPIKIVVISSRQYILNDTDVRHYKIIFRLINSMSFFFTQSSNSVCLWKQELRFGNELSSA